MASVFFGNASRIIAQVLTWLQVSDQGKTSNLITDTFQVGIDKSTNAGEGFTIVAGILSGAFASVTVQGQGIAYDPLGNRIFISSSDTTTYNASNPTQTTNDGTGTFVLTPQSTGCVNIPIQYNMFNYLWIDYLATTDTSVYTLNKITNAKIFYKLTDGYNIQVTTTNVAPDSNSIFLGTVNLTGVLSGTTPPSTISQAGRTYFSIYPNIAPITTPQANRSDATTIYNPASTYNYETHIKCVGTNVAGVSPTNPHAMSLADLGVSTLDTVTGHRQLEHQTVPNSGNAAANVVIAGVPGTPYPSTSALSQTINIVNPGSDYLTIHQLLSSEFVIVNGTAYNVNQMFGSIPTDVHIFFPNVSGTYNVFWDAVVQAFSSSTSDISADVTKIWIATVTYTFVGTGPSDHNSLSSLLDRRRVGSTTHLLQRWITNSRPGSGSTAPSTGEFGFNLTNGSLEYWDGSVWQQPVNSSANNTVPSGAMVDFAGASAPTGWLLCDGSAVSRSVFSNLFASIGTIWGPGDGSTTFNLPDFRRRAAVGSGGTGTGTLGNTVGSVGGEETHTLITTEIPAHNHIASSSVTDPGHFHTEEFDTGVVAAGTAVSGISSRASGQTGNSVTTSNTTGISVSTTTNNTGGSGAHNNIQPSAIVTKIIKI